MRRMIDSYNYLPAYLDNTCMRVVTQLALECIPIMFRLIFLRYILYTRIHSAVSANFFLILYSLIVGTQQLPFTLAVSSDSGIDVTLAFFQTHPVSILLANKVFCSERAVVLIV